MTRLPRILALLLWLAALAHAQYGHAAGERLPKGRGHPGSGGSGESSLSLHVEGVSLRGEWQVPLRDLDMAVALDTNNDGEIAWPEISHRRGEIEEYLSSHLRVLADGGDPGMRFDKLAYGTRDGEPFVLSNLTATATASIRILDVDYTLLFERVPSHRGIVTVVWQGRGSQRAVISAPGAANLFDRELARAMPFWELLKSGVWHIWIGYDHALFLLVLLIPAVFQRTAAGREAASDFAGTFARVVAIVSAFTVAHSITLSLAGLGVIVLPSRLIESAIAVSVVVAALVNLLPRTAGASSVWVAFAFGLLHGLGFANVLSEVDAAGEPLWRTLLGFNLGVELGQLAIVAAFLPIAFLLRHTRFYRAGVLYGGSSAAAVCALFWFWQRAF